MIMMKFGAYKQIPRETRRSRNFVEMLERRLKFKFGANNVPGSLNSQKWPTWITDQKSVEKYLTTTSEWNGDDECIPETFV